jgi:putative acetyltransferase
VTGASGEQFALRRATIADAQEIWRIHTSAIRQSCAQAYSRHAIETWVNMLRPEKYHEQIGAMVFRVAEDGSGHLLGFALFFPRSGELNALYVAPHAQRQGIGAALLEDVHRLARSLGHATVHLRATLNAESFYARHGYLTRGRTEHRLTADIALPCVEMLCALD